MKRAVPGVLVLHNLPRESAGTSAWVESDVGVLGEVDAVVAGLSRLGVEHRVAGVRSLRDIPSALAGGTEGIVFNLVESLHGEPYEANYVPVICQAHGKAATGCDTPCLTLTMDKGRTKSVLQAAGLPTPSGVLVPPGATVRRPQLPPGPYMVKPAHSDASEGIGPDSVVERVGAKLNEVVKRVHREFRQPALIEQFVGRRELNISILQQGDRVEVMPIAEIDFSAFAGDRPRIVDYEAKWIEDSFAFRNTPRIIPAAVSARVAENIRRLSLEAWSVMGCRDYVRVDCRLDDRGRVYILEVNANPDITPGDGFPAALEAGGIGYDRFLRILLDNAAARLAKAARPPRKRTSARASEKRAATRIRPARPEDRHVILDLLAKTGFFRPDELEVAREVLDESLTKGPEGCYRSHVAVGEDDVVRGWVCFGPTPCALGTYDVYWIATDPCHQGRGLGKAMMARAEKLIAEQGGRLVIVETAGKAHYDSTRKFYLKIGYQEAARVKDFYAPHDDKGIYTKSLSPNRN